MACGPASRQPSLWAAAQCAPASPRTGATARTGCERACGCQSEPAASSLLLLSLLWLSSRLLQPCVPRVIITICSREGLGMAGGARKGLKRDWQCRHTIEAAHTQWKQFLLEAPEYPSAQFRGRGIVILAGSLQYMVPAWVNVVSLRRAGDLLCIRYAFHC